MVEPIVAARDVTKLFGSKTALEAVSADVFPGDIIGVLGKNGAGKTTLLETLLGFSTPNRGSVTVFGEDALAMSAQTKARIGFLPQLDELFAMLNGKQHLAIVSAFHANWDRALVERLVAEWSVPLTRRIDSLSVGERQKLAVLSALGHRPDLLVLDEPTVGLDPVLRAELWGTFHELAGAGKTLLVSSHVMDEASECDGLLLMRDGELLEQTTPGELRERTGEQDLGRAFLAVIEAAAR